MSNLTGQEVVLNGQHYNLDDKIVVIAGWNGTAFVPLQIAGGGIPTAQAGAANANVTQVVTTGTAASLAIARSTRSGIAIGNPTGSAGTVWVGKTGVTSGTGFAVPPNCIFIPTWVGQIFIVDDGTNHVTVSVWDEYN